MLDCKDKSDELGCEILVLEESYRKTSPPVRLSWEKKRVRKVGEQETKVRKVIPANVKVSLNLLDVAGIREADNEIDIKFRAQFDWFESRATYHNLKKRSSQNTLVDTDINRLWIPNIVYRNNKDNDDTLTALEKSRLKIKRMGNFSRSSLDILDEVEIFQGSENPISMTQSYTKPFKCKYELRYFPFDTQVGKWKTKLYHGVKTGLLHHSRR